MFFDFEFINTCLLVLTSIVWSLIPFRRNSYVMYIFIHFSNNPSNIEIDEISKYPSVLKNDE